MFAQEPCTLDVDGDGYNSAETDGQLILRFLFGAFGDLDKVTISDAIGTDSVRQSASEIFAYLGNCSAMLDADADRRADALTDGILIFRYLSGMEGDALTSTSPGK